MIAPPTAHVDNFARAIRTDIARYSYCVIAGLAVEPPPPLPVRFELIGNAEEAVNRKGVNHQKHLHYR
jgi:hypothetical protein